MSYVQITKTPAMTTADYDRVQRELGPEPRPGHLVHLVGVVDGTLVIVDEWATRADADRFAAQRLFPAFERAGIRPQATAEITAFETAVRV